MLIFYITFINLSNVKKRANDDMSDYEYTISKRNKDELSIIKALLDVNNDPMPIDAYNADNITMKFADKKVEDTNETAIAETKFMPESLRRLNAKEVQTNFDVITPLDANSLLTADDSELIKQILNNGDKILIQDETNAGDFNAEKEVLFTEPDNPVEKSLIKLKEKDGNIFYLTEEARSKIDQKCFYIYFEKFGRKNILAIIYNVEDKYLFNILFLINLIRKTKNIRKIFEKLSTNNFNFYLNSKFKEIYFEKCINNLTTKKFKQINGKRLSQIPMIMKLVVFFNTFIFDTLLDCSKLLDYKFEHVYFLYEAYNKHNLFKDINEFLRNSVIHFLTHPNNKMLRYLYPEFDWIITMIKNNTLEQLNLERIYIICTIIAYNFEFMKSNIKTEIKENYSKDNLTINSRTLITFILNTRVLLHAFFIRSMASEIYIKQSLLLCLFSLIRCRNTKLFFKFYFDDIFLVTLRDTFEISEFFNFIRSKFVFIKSDHTEIDINFYKIQSLLDEEDDEDIDSKKIVYLDFILKRIKLINPKLISKIFFISEDKKLFFDFNGFLVEIRRTWAYNILELFELYDERNDLPPKENFYQ